VVGGDGKRVVGCVVGEGWVSNKSKIDPVYFLSKNRKMATYTKMVKENPDKYPTRMGQPWTSDEVSKLLVFIANNKQVGDIAKEHQRSEGGITAQIRKMAYEYYKNDKKSIEEIKTLTGLSDSQIIDTIAKRDGIKDKKTENKYVTSPPVFNAEAEIKAIKADMAVMKKDIKEILACMKAVYEFETADD